MRAQILIEDMPDGNVLVRGFVMDGPFHGAELRAKEVFDRLLEYAANLQPKEGKCSPTSKG